jgi:hypothetical protein
MLGLDVAPSVFCTYRKYFSRFPNISCNGEKHHKKAFRTNVRKQIITSLPQKE